MTRFERWATRLLVEHISVPVSDWCRRSSSNEEV